MPTGTTVESRANGSITQLLFGVGLRRRHYLFSHSATPRLEERRQQGAAFRRKQSTRHRNPKIVRRHGENFSHALHHSRQENNNPKNHTHNTNKKKNTRTQHTKLEGH